MIEKDVIDVDFQEANNKNEINGRPLYFSTSQVSQMINETDSTIRFWCSKFKDIIKIEMSGSHRKFSDENIEKLKYIQKLLREDKFSISQVQQYASEKDPKVIENQVQKQEPLAMQALATAIAIEIGGQLEDYKLMIRDQLIEEIRNGQKDLKDSLTSVIKNQVNEEMTELKSFISTKELEAKNRDNEMIDLMRSNMEKRKEENAQNEKRGLWNRIFGR